MYGVFGPTERINGAPGSDWLRQLCGGSHSYWSDSYWQRFPDLLARNRETTYFVKNGEAAR